MPEIPAVTPRKAIRALERAGFLFVRQKGSHRLYQKDKRIVVVPYHNKDLKRPTLKNIIHQAGLTVDEFLKFL